MGHATLKILILSFNIIGNDVIGDDVAIKLADALKKNTMLKTLDLAGNEAITEVGWSVFAGLYFAARQALRRPYSPTTLLRVWAISVIFPRDLLVFLK